MEQISKAELDELFERSKNDHTFIAGSEVRRIIGNLRRANEKLQAYRESGALEALKFIADCEDFTFAECSLAEEIVSRAFAARLKLEAIEK